MWICNGKNGTNEGLPTSARTIEWLTSRQYTDGRNCIRNNPFVFFICRRLLTCDSIIVWFYNKLLNEYNGNGADTLWSADHDEPLVVIAHSIFLVTISTCMLQYPGAYAKIMFAWDQSLAQNMNYDTLLSGVTISAARIYERKKPRSIASQTNAATQYSVNQKNQ